MARSVRFGKFKWDRTGYKALMDSGPVQAAIARPARAVLSAANGMLAADGYERDGFEVKPFEGKLTRGMVVRTKTDHARYSQAKHKTLTKALGQAKGA